MARVKLSAMPDARREYTVDFPRLDGGLNTWELGYRLNANESPEMKNLWWKNGALCSRDGQVYLSEDVLGTAKSAYEGLYYDHAFFHIGDKLYSAYIPDRDVQAMWESGIKLKPLRDGVGEEAGTWFRFGDQLYYKNPGGYYAVSIDGQMITCGDVPAYTPVVQVDTDPVTAAGKAYQSENRLCAQKTVCYSTVPGVKEYCLPVQNIENVDRVVVDGVVWPAVQLVDGGRGYAVDLDRGVVTFSAEPPHHDPAQANTVSITYTKSDPEAYSSVMDCARAVVYGRDQNVCVVLAGCKAQPSAYFWCGKHDVMDPGYFPVEQYNLAGDAQDAITGFGRQQNMLVIFKERSVGRCSMSSKEWSNGRVQLMMDYTSINAAIGCDLPGSIQLIENNLVFANTRNGVCIVLDSSSAYENNIMPISRKVDNGLIELLRRSDAVCSYDDGERYWIAADGEVYCWDYTLSGYRDPVWFYFTNIPAKVFLNAGQTTMHLDGKGRLSAMWRHFEDYGAAIEKKYRFAAQHFGGYDRLKDITSVIFAVRGDTNTSLEVAYLTDYENRKDLTPVRATSWRLCPRDLTFRDLSISEFTTVARRKPGCRHVRHFAMELSNNEIGMDMAVISAQVFYRYQGRDK